MSKMSFAIAAIAALSLTHPVEARSAVGVKIKARLFSIVDNNPFTDVMSSIERIRGAKLVSVSQSQDGTSVPMLAYTFAPGTDVEAAVRKVLGAFHAEGSATVNDIVPVGKALPLSVGAARDYVRKITYIHAAGSKTTKAVKEIGVAEEGLYVSMTPKIERGLLKIEYNQKFTKLTGPDDGFRKLTVGNDTIQLKRQSQRAVVVDVITPKADEPIVLVMRGAGERDYAVTIMSASKIR
jgi:hypothetical protein